MSGEETVTPKRAIGTFDDRIRAIDELIDLLDRYEGCLGQLLEVTRDRDRKAAALAAIENFAARRKS